MKCVLLRKGIVSRFIKERTASWIRFVLLVGSGTGARAPHTSCILDVAPPWPHSVEGASNSVDPPLSFDTMSRFVTRFDDIFDGNNNMSIFEYLPMPQHFPLITTPVPTTHIYDVDDVVGKDDLLDGQPKCDYDTENRKVTPITGSTELIDFGTPDQFEEIKIGSSLSPDERS